MSPRVRLKVPPPQPAPTPCAFCGEPIDARDRNKRTAKQTVLVDVERETGNMKVERGSKSLVFHEVCGAPPELASEATDGIVCS